MVEHLFFWDKSRVSYNFFAGCSMLGPRNPDINRTAGTNTIVEHVDGASEGGKYNLS